VIATRPSAIFFQNRKRSEEKQLSTAGGTRKAKGDSFRPHRVCYSAQFRSECHV
jgi:hypothetical protein